MDLEGQHGRAGESGYAMATLLVALAVMSVLMTAALPAWRHQARREKEAELVFRGEQYVRAIQLWERKMGPGSRPPNVDMLVQQRFLRKKYKDPMTEDGEFQPLFAGVNQPAPGAPGAPGGGRGGRGGPQIQAPPQQQPPQSGIPSGAGGAGGGGIIGVASKSKETSIRIYKGRTHYNEWLFVHQGSASTPGGGDGSRTPGGRGGRGTPGIGPDGPGGRGRGIGPGGGGPGGRGFGPGIGFPPGGRGRGQ